MAIFGNLCFKCHLMIVEEKTHGETKVEGVHHLESMNDKFANWMSYNP